MPHLETASLGVWIGAGSRHESPREHGLSHLLEHMAFKGTRRRSARAIAEEIESRRGRPQRRDRRRAHRLYAARPGRRHEPRARHPRRHPHRQPVRSRPNSSARRASSSRRSARTRTRRTISSSTCSTPPPFPTSRSAGRSSARPNGVRSFDRDRHRRLPRRRTISAGATVVGGGRRGRPRPARSTRPRAPFRRIADRGAAARGARPAMSAARRGSSAGSSRPTSSSASRGAPFTHDDHYAAAGVRQRGRRRHVVAPVPGRPRDSAASPMRSTAFHWAYADTGPVRLLCGDRRARRCANSCRWRSTVWRPARPI